MPKQMTLPPESARILNDLARDAADLIAETEAILAITLTPDSSARLLDHALRHRTKEVARTLRALNFYCRN